ncbi:cobalt/nickel transport system permease protein [Dehalogenimonas formicexedens]|uniref:Cobalt/nickel transport system permease protein n=1 Tax=Dehalogenimonas formicexedens TaxID=1839801 RepID=A0A1P8F4G1_9CHLR|nr:energy-coupling factor ABC transporter permease [Dehalogenimonas formicexedens]APV43371.1 cobalt/nickel transport system permease protein [Dehalogenimonas formicexedens]
MHIPDGFLNVPTLAATGAVSAGTVGLAVKVAAKKIGEKQVPLMGMLAAFIFAAQMLNFPVAGGTSGHLIGAALCAILIGPWAGVIIMSAVLIAQALIFQDGGLASLGANILNMGIIAVFGSYLIYRLVTKILPDTRRGKLIGGAAAGWTSVMFSALAAAFELAASGASPFAVVGPAMLGVHALIGAGEGLITVLVVSAVMASRADVLQMERI